MTVFASGPSRVLAKADATSFVLLLPVALSLWTSAVFGAGPFGGGLLLAIVFSPFALLALLTGAVLRLLGRTSPGTWRVVLTGLGLAVAGLLAMPVVVHVQQSQEDRAAARVERLLSRAATECATQAVAEVPEATLEPLALHLKDTSLRAAMLSCLEGSTLRAALTDSSWTLQCEPLGCSAYAAESPRHLSCTPSGFLDRGLLQAGRPGWSRLQYPGSPPPVPEVSDSRDDGS